MDEKTMYTLMVDLHREGSRQGPGSEEETHRALDLAGLDESRPLRVADIGCGTGASTLVLARRLAGAEIVAVDLFPEFLDILSAGAAAAGLAGRIQTRAQSMDSLSFEPESLDLIWSEGAVYNLGFGRGIRRWREFLRPGGVIAVSEITWLHPDPPEEIRRYWDAEYPEIATAAAKISLLEDSGYDLLGYLTLSASSWLDNYYDPTEARIPGFLDRHSGSPEAREIAEMERREADLYRRYRNWFSYGFYIAGKR